MGVRTFPLPRTIPAMTPSLIFSEDYSPHDNPSIPPPLLQYRIVLKLGTGQGNSPGFIYTNEHPVYCTI